MRQFGLIIAFVFAALTTTVSAKIVTDTIRTGQNDMVILQYNLSRESNVVSFQVTRPPRIIPTDNLRKACKGSLDKLKVVVFDRLGSFGDVKWRGMTPSKFMLPAKVQYEWSQEGYYILGESTPILFTLRDNSDFKMDIPINIAVYEKKQTYKLVRTGSLHLKLKASERSEATRGASRQSATETVVITGESSEETADITNALSSIDMIRQLLATENELPFSQTLQMEIYNLRSLKNKISDRDVLAKIDDVVLEYANKESELKAQQNAANLAAQAQEKAEQEQLKAEEERRQQEADEKAKAQEEKQQKRTIWMMIGGAILAVLCFVGNAVFRHFRDVQNQKSVMAMQQSLTKQAENEARRRTREIVRNKAHNVANKGRVELRDKMQNVGKKQSKSDRKSI